MGPKHLLLTGLLLCTERALAVTCSVSGVQPINFGTVNPLSSSGVTTSMTFNYSCAKELGDVLAGINLCFNIGVSAVSGGIATRSMSLSGSPANTLNYQLYQDVGHTLVWGNQNQAGTTFPMIQLTLLNLIPVTGSLTVYAKLPTPQTISVPGIYQDSYTVTTANVTRNIGLLAPPTTCGTTVAATYPFTVMASVTKQCNISYTNNVDFGSVNAAQNNTTAFNTIGVACSSNTPYTIGLLPSNGNAVGSGVMHGSGTNSDTVPYQLNTAPGASARVWGNSEPNVVSGTGTGSTIDYSVYATVPNANYNPDSYSDIISINVVY